MHVLTRPWSTAIAGAAIALIILVVWLSGSRLDTLGLVSFLARFAHMFAAMLWVGMICFVNFIQLAALANTDDSGRATLMKHVVPHVGAAFRGASHVVLASGLVLLLTNGYVLDRWVFPSAVYIPTFRGLMIWSGVAAGIVMWALVQFVISPALRAVLDPGSELSGKTAARERMRLAARINLMLSIPVTFVMIAAAHLY